MSHSLTHGCFLYTRFTIIPGNGMSQINIHIDPLSTSCVLKYLGLAIDEIKLVRSIRSLSEQVLASDELKLDISRRRYLVSELQFLHKRLETLREKAGTQ
jgi:hypothetical protein